MRSSQSTDWAAMGVVASGDDEVDFKPDQVATEAWQDKMTSLANDATPEDFVTNARAGLTRGEFCRQLWERIEKLPLRPFAKRKAMDADDDGIPDQVDPTPFTPGPVVEWSVRLPGPTEDGIADFASSAETVKRFNFTPLGSASVAGFTNDYGHKFSDGAGQGVEGSDGRKQSAPQRVPRKLPRYVFCSLVTRQAGNVRSTMELGKSLFALATRRTSRLANA